MCMRLRPGMTSSPLISTAITCILECSVALKIEIVPRLVLDLDDKAWLPFPLAKLVHVMHLDRGKDVRSTSNQQVQQ